METCHVYFKSSPGFTRAFKATRTGWNSGPRSSSGARQAHIGCGKFKTALGKRLISLVSVLMVFSATACSSLKSSGSLLVDETIFKKYKHAAISPKTPARSRSAAANALKSKGFTVYRAPVFDKVRQISPEIPVLYIECQDAGMTMKRFGDWSMTVDCLAFDLHSDIALYEGSGEYMGISIAENFYGATAAALSNVPKIGSNGKSTIRMTLPTASDAIAGADDLRFEGNSRQGTAWSIGNGGVITCYHVVADATRIQLVLNDGREINAELVMRDAANDIALLRVESGHMLPPALSISTEIPSLGSDVFTVGYPHADLMGTSPKVTTGKINAITGIRNDPRFYQISVPLQSGNSGGPLFNMKGEVIGIVTAKLHAIRVFNETGDLPQNVNYSVKGQYIKALMDTAGSRKAYHGARIQPAALEELAGRVKDSVIIVKAN